LIKQKLLFENLIEKVKIVLYLNLEFSKILQLLATENSLLRLLLDVMIRNGHHLTFLRKKKNDLDSFTDVIVTSSPSTMNFLVFFSVFFCRFNF
jgi:hypothetical protein